MASLLIHHHHQFSSSMLLLCILFLSSCAAADQPNTTDQFIDVHNQARAAVGVGPLKWSSNLARGASLMVRYQRDKKKCQFADLSRSNYGANQGWASYPITPVEAVGYWVEQKKYYDHASNTCLAGHDGCGTYTQVVWRKSAEVGCAQARCGNGDTLTVCFYFPHGNVQGKSPY